ncbi:B3 domain-containing protein Os04g0386900-like isoform X2 [Malania oleifera]|uniref:B3 domain-containing protein Os04g0386900-like isoform X2 n=1 Tax=Malania oleifera TaxID=397392 RepID=UPI0025AE170D|nr:B3 domain-containing protein Os04g0386900-like isoform X2 [Malania oleifera]XP_057980821.1 B3 domain-containing protein Os04g0386900-like isoform X2 [Malania oleifera]XP_057980822.1 B3 domain-containing protein Os04g0386900-like isoform X2 [Malania oleifera]
MSCSAGDSSHKGKLHFSVILARSHVKPVYQMVVPSRMYPILPSFNVPVELIYRSKVWQMIYMGGNRTHKRFDSKWKVFVNDNNLRAGDACVFEIMECSDTNIKFKVQILRGDIPFNLVERKNGESLDSAVVIE